MRTFLILASVLLTTSCVARGPWSERFIDPVSAGTTFESPVIESSLEAHAVRQEFPDDSVFGGGEFTLLALQARLAVSERLAVIATKDGFIDLQPDAGADETGLADIAGGVKYMAYANPDTGIIVTPGLIFEFASGDEEVFQGNGDGLLRPFVSAGWDRDKLNVLSAVGFNQPLDTDAETSSLDYHLHVSYEALTNFFPLVEVNGITYTSNGAALPVDFEGGDLINLGATDVSGQTVISGALGGAYNFTDSLQLGVTYEWPWTSRQDLMENRVWVALLWRF